MRATPELRGNGCDRDQARTRMLGGRTSLGERDGGRGNLRWRRKMVVGLEVLSLARMTRLEHLAGACAGVRNASWSRICLTDAKR
jgi:hypothetical protein